MSILRLLAATSSSVSAPNAYFLITTGQSNEQCADLGSDGSMPSDWLDPQPDIMIYNFGDKTTSTALHNGYVSPGEFRQMQPNVNTMSVPFYDGITPVPAGYWGPEQALLHDIADNVLPTAPAGSKVFILKVTEGGLPISYWEPGGKLRLLLDDHVPDSINYLIGAGYNVIPVAMCWGQGEDNAGNSTASYQPKLEEVISHVRGLHPLLTDLPVFIRKLAAIQTFYNSTQKGTINTAFDNIAASDPNVYTLDLDTISGLAVETILYIHYTVDSKLIIGHEMYNLMHANNAI